MADTSNEDTASSGGGASSNNNKGWIIAFAVVTVLLIAAVLFIVFRGSDSDQTATTATTTGQAGTSVSTTSTTKATVAPSVSTTSTTASSPSSSASEPYDIVCTSGDLFAVIDPSVLAQGATVVAYECAPATVGDAANAYAWARLESPGVEPLVVFYSGTARDPATSPHVMNWKVLSYGTSVFCQDVIPQQTCDMLPGAPR